MDPAFGQRLRQLRLRRGLTQQQLASGEFTKAFISHIETGRSRVSLRAAGIIAQRLSVDVRDLLAPGADSGAQAELQLAIAERDLARNEPALAVERVHLDPGVSPVLRARALRIQGLARMALGQPREAVRVLEDAVRQFRALGDTELRIRSTFDLAYAHAALDQPGQSGSLLLECEAALETGELVDRTLELKVHALLAAFFDRVGDPASADFEAERALALSEDVVDKNALDTLYASLVATRREQGDFEGALVYARKGLQLHEEAGREAEAVHVWNNLAWIYIERGQHSRAQSSLDRAERLARERALPGFGYLVITRARLELARGNFDKALELATRAMSDSQTLEKNRAQARFIHAMALAGAGRPNSKVRAAFEAALAAYASQPARRRANVHQEYARVLADRGSAKEAYQQARMALNLLRGA